MPVCVYLQHKRHHRETILLGYILGCNMWGTMEVMTHERCNGWVICELCSYLFLLAKGRYFPSHLSIKIAAFLIYFHSFVGLLVFTCTHQHLHHTCWQTGKHPSPDKLEGYYAINSNNYCVWWACLNSSLTLATLPDASRPSLKSAPPPGPRSRHTINLWESKLVFKSAFFQA
jgi:hypothetical protein